MTFAGQGTSKRDTGATNDAGRVRVTDVSQTNTISV